MVNKNKIAIQGIEGSFHHAVAQSYFDKSIKVICCSSFDQLVFSILENHSTYGVMAIENSIAGSIIPNYALIDQNDLNIVGEYYYQIQHSLLALPNQNIDDILEVHSHPMALLQCKDFFSKFSNIKLVESDDTANAAKEISKNNILKRAAIASKTAAGLYNLEILEDAIQTISKNVTRFVIIQKELPVKNINYNKASLKFILDHKRGSLATVLNVMSDCKLNLTKIQSLPVIETPGKYSFFVDVTFDSSSFFDKALSILQIMTLELKVLGKYNNGNI
jgi:prephenate dehydratase|tara:strand:+ start:187 stop:1017 length:831 start_codon:yes stop_codon:yes gene_type:complete